MVEHSQERKGDPGEPETENYWTPWFNGGHWVHYGIPDSPSESVWMPVWHEDASFNY